MARIVEELLLRMLPVHHREPDNGHACQKHIVCLVQEDVVLWCARESTKDAKEEDGKYEEQILVEGVVD